MDEPLIKSWPALLVGLILATYWVRVMQLVRATKRKAGHHANLVPEEPLGRFLRIIWIPVVVLWIFLPILGGFGILTRFAPMRPIVSTLGWRIVQWIALMIAIIAFVITWVCWINMGKSWRMGIDPNEKTQLVFTGPFAYVRNPIYGLSSLLAFLTMVIFPSPAMLVIGILHILLLQWEVRREEVYLLSVHGDAYAAYLQNVGRFVPRSLRAYRPQ
jgi:protein-S-isoprenylcysteine O-methyltransferase Ste14